MFYNSVKGKEGNQCKKVKGGPFVLVRRDRERQRTRGKKTNGEVLWKIIWGYSDADWPFGSSDLGNMTLPCFWELGVNFNSIGSLLLYIYIYICKRGSFLISSILTIQEFTSQQSVCPLLFSLTSWITVFTSHPQISLFFFWTFTSFFTQPTFYSSQINFRIKSTLYSSLI